MTRDKGFQRAKRVGEPFITTKRTGALKLQRFRPWSYEQSGDRHFLWKRFWHMEQRRCAEEHVLRQWRLVCVDHGYLPGSDPE